MALGLREAAPVVGVACGRDAGRVSDEQERYPRPARELGAGFSGMAG